jgi:hypothetical protein
MLMQVVEPVHPAQQAVPRVLKQSMQQCQSIAALASTALTGICRLLVAEFVLRRIVPADKSLILIVAASPALLTACSA